MRDLIFLSIEDWDYIWRRNQFVCAELVRRRAEMRILFVGLPRNVSHALRHGRIGPLLRRGTYPASGAERVTVTHPLKLLPDSIGLGRAINQWMYRRHARRVARRLGMRRPVLWINPQWAGHMAGRLGESALIYDVTDDWTQLSQSPRMKRLTERQDRELCAKADAVIVCSPRLAELKRPMNGNVHLIPNGVDVTHYARTAAGDGPLPKAAADWKHPVLGYTGTVHSDRVDVELLRAVARNWPGSVVLVGPNLLSPTDAARLELPNVYRVGPVPYAEVPDYMRAIDVCIVPHKMTAFTESLNPIKLWEYLASGKPIVSTDVAGFRDYPRLARIVRTAEEFLVEAREAVAEAGAEGGSALAAKRQAIAHKNSWNERVDEIERVIDSLLKAPESGGSAGITARRQPTIVH